MEHHVEIYDIQENGRSKADLKIPDLNLFISGFRVVPGTMGKGAIVHMPKGMGTDWKYSEIAWPKVREMISAVYLENSQIKEIYVKLFETADAATSLQVVKPSEHQPYSSAELIVDLYNFDYKKDTCQASIILPGSRRREEGFSVKQAGNAVHVYMPKQYGMKWRFREITWKEVQKAIAEQYRKENKFIQSGSSIPVCQSGFAAEFHHVSEIYRYNLLIQDDIQTIGTATLEIRNESYSIKIDEETLETVAKYDLDKAELEELSKTAFSSEQFISEQKNFLHIEVEYCTGYSLCAFVDFILPGSTHEWKNFYIRELESGEVVVKTPNTLHGKWSNPHYPWKVLCEMIEKEYRRFKETSGFSDKTEEDLEQSHEVESEKHEKTEAEFNNEAERKSEEPVMSKKKKQLLDTCNQLGRVRNAEHSAFSFVPHSILKLVPAEFDRKYLVQKLIAALNSPQGGIGAFEIEILDWISRLKYVSKTMLLDLVLSGYISLGNREKITATKVTDVMNRLYKFDLIEMSRFVAVDDNGEPLEERKKAIYRIHTLGATGYNLLREMGRHPERRNSFGVLADGNTVKKHLSATQWLVYWLTHYSKDEILDYSINTILNQMGQKWNGAKVYAIITFDAAVIVAEPVRRCEDFEIEINRIELKEKLLRFIEMFDHEDQLYNETRDQVVFSTRPIVSFVCEDDEHMKEIAAYMAEMTGKYPQQEMWFTSDPRMYNYNYAGERFYHLCDGELRQLVLEDAIGLPEKTMEELGQLL
ncbi:MAG: hypothetical protein Q4F28_10760 [Eubacteriales bacterium]|nr:hypothetical protein [Eubacteriales bacterium]